MRPTFRGALAVLLTLPLVAGHPASASVGPHEDTSVVVDRIAGTDRWRTAARISEQFPDGVGTVFIANGEDRSQGADAVVAGAAAGSGTLPPVISDPSGHPAPILLVRAGGIPGPTRAALAELQPDHAVVLGGTTVVSTAVEQELVAMGIEPVRVRGTNRYGTAAELARAFEPGPQTVYIATGEASPPPRGSEAPWMMPDALTASARAGAEGVPVLLTRRSTIPSSTLAALELLDPQSITIVGGEGSVSGFVEWELGKIAPVARVAGSTRYETTARLFADYPTGASMAYLASGEHFADALTVSALAASEGAPVQLSRRFGMTGVTRDALVALDPAAVRLVGGETVLDEVVMQQVRDLLSP